MERIFIGKVTRDSTSPHNFYLRNLQMDTIYDSHDLFASFEGKEVIVKISDMEKGPRTQPSLCLNVSPL